MLALQVEWTLGDEGRREFAVPHDPGPVVVDLTRDLVALISSAILDHPRTAVAIPGGVTAGLMDEQRGENQEFPGFHIQRDRAFVFDGLRRDRRVDPFPDVLPMPGLMRTRDRLEAPVFQA